MFEIGDRIRFKYTGLEAEILENHQDGTYTVWLMEEADEGIAFEEDIVLATAFDGVQLSQQQKELPQKKKQQPKGPSTEDLFFSSSEQEARRLQALQPSNNRLLQQAAKHKKKSVEPSLEAFVPKGLVDTPPQGLGCFLAFHQTAEDHYTILLVNDTPVSFSFRFSLYLKQHLEHGFNKVIPASSYFPIGEFWKAQFNDSPHIEFSCPNFKFSKKLKLKYKKFLTTNGPVPLIGISCAHYLLFSKLEGYSKPSASIKDYTIQQQQFTDTSSPNYRRADLLTIASFKPELDLHAEKLVNDTSEYSAGELYELQLRALDTFITQAATLELEEVFVIHGLGKGKLRAGVEQYLRYHGDVKSYSNEYHNNYGFGATRVIFKR
jgi:uncharacterized protein YecA (UPF0149 family)